MKPEKNKQITVALPPSLLSTLSFYVDGVNFRNRSHIIHQAIAEWIERQDKGRGEQTIIPGTRPARPLKKKVKR